MSGKNIKVRSASAEDADRIFDFISWLEEAIFDKTDFKKIYLENISNENNIYLVAVDESEEAIGFISCHGQDLLHHGGMTFEIQELYVDRQYRERGVAHSLIKALFEELKTNECVSIEVAVNKERKLAHSFYSKLGFSSTHIKFTKSPTHEKPGRNNPHPQPGA
jgi:PhnO protein